MKIPRIQDTWPVTVTILGRAQAVVIQYCLIGMLAQEGQQDKHAIGGLAGQFASFLWLQ